MAFSLIGAMGFLEYHYLKQKLRHVKGLPYKTSFWAKGSILRGEHQKMKGCLKRLTEVD